MSVYIKENENLTNVLYSINNTTSDDYNIKFSNKNLLLDTIFFDSEFATTVKKK